MCRTKRDAVAADPQTRSSSKTSGTNSSSSAAVSSVPADSGGNHRAATASYSSASSSSVTSRSSLASLRSSLPERPAVYPFAEIRSATHNFLSKRLSSASWRCTLRGRDAVVFQRPFRGGDPSAVPARLAGLCRSHHSSIVRLLGASLAGGHIYLAYDYARGASLVDCLRNPRNPGFSPLSSWLARMQVAADLAQGLEYIHTQFATVHNHIKSSGIIVTDPDLRAKICHFGAADLAGEIPAAAAAESGEIHEAGKVTRSGSRRMRIEGTRGYMAPEMLAGGNISQRSDVFAFGVVLLELLSGDEPIKYLFDTERSDYQSGSVIEAAREVIGPLRDEDEDATAAAEERRWRIRRWVDRRLRDSFPVEAAEQLIGVALRCVEAEPGKRPDMMWVAGKVSELLLHSQKWGQRVRVPSEISVSLAPR